MGVLHLLPLPLTCVMQWTRQAEHMLDSWTDLFTKFQKQELSQVPHLTALSLLY
jgi:hypothetical protein